MATYDLVRLKVGKNLKTAEAFFPTYDLSDLPANFKPLLYSVLVLQ